MRINYESIEPPRRVDDGDSQTKKNYSIFFLGIFYCIVVPAIFNPSFKILILAFMSLSCMVLHF